MSSNKEHHYVPQFHLRRFATDSGEKLIGLYNLHNGIHLTNAPIRKQAKFKNYYGTDGTIETVLSVLEGHAAQVMTSIINTKEPPSIKTDAYGFLMYFILFQERRTKRAENDTNDQINKLKKTAFEKMGKTAPKGHIPISEILMTAINGIRVCDHLRCQLLINDTTIPFITSDNPVVMNNELMEGLNRGAGAGWATKGLQAFYPVTPQLMLIWTDPYVYRCGGKSRREVIHTNVESDIAQLNALQYLNCQDQIFFNNDFSKKHLKVIVDKYHSVKINATPNVVSFGSFTFVTGIEYNIKLKLSFNKLSREGKEFRPGGRLVYLRHPDLEKERQR